MFPNKIIKDKSKFILLNSVVRPRGLQKIIKKPYSYIMGHTFFFLGVLATLKVVIFSFPRAPIPQKASKTLAK